MSNNTTCYKNMICISVGLLIIFTTSIFVAKDYFGVEIETLIDEATLLKDYHYSDWGQYPGNIDADYQYKITLFDYPSNHMKKQMRGEPLAPITFRHSFNYKNISFGQGNQGFIKYLHHWNIDPINTIPNVTLNTINIEAQKIYGYQKLATKSRRFTTLYNALWESVQGMLTKFYALHLHSFYFKYQQIVSDAIFKEIGLGQTLIDAVYNDDQYGWKDAGSFQIWVKLAHLKNRKELREYEMIMDYLGISEETMERLIGDHSVLNSLSTAMNGTIKLIVQNSKSSSPYKPYSYKNCVPFCNNNQLVAFQLLTGNLTKAPIFVNVNIDQNLMKLNQTFWNDVQFNLFCGSSGSQCVYDDNMIEFFAQKYLANYTTMHKVFQNIDNLQIVKNLFGFDDQMYTQSVLDYMQYLQSNIFNPTHPLTQEIDLQAYDYMLNNYIYINKAVNSLKDVLNIQIHARGLTQILVNQGTKCQDFFTGDYQTFIKLCSNADYNLNTLDGVRNYVKAYFFEERTKFAKETTMTPTQSAQFLKLDGNSLFASKMRDLRTTIKNNYKCSEKYCSSEDLLWLQWSGQTDVLSNLPKELFSTTPKSILQWDVQGKLNKAQPQYYKVMSQKLSFEKGKQLLGDGPNSILSLFNLLLMKIKTDANDIIASKLVNYVQKSTINMFFSGPTSNKRLPDLINGFESVGIATKKSEKEQIGGASWLPSKVALFQTRHESTYFNKINTGIYDKGLLRNMMEVNRYQQLGSEFIVFQNQYQDVRKFLPSGRKVFGTDLLGFHSDLSNTESLSVFLDFAYQGIILIPQKDLVDIDGIESIKYSVKQTNSAVFIGLDQQNQRSITISPQSYFIVDPITGSTLQFLVKYTVTSKTSFLKYYYLHADQTDITLYTNEVYYSRSDISQIQKISNEIASLKLVYLITIILASVSMISIVAFTIILRIKTKRRGGELNDTLISSVSDGSLLANA